MINYFSIARARAARVKDGLGFGLLAQPSARYVGSCMALAVAWTRCWCSLCGMLGSEGNQTIHPSVAVDQ